MLTVMLADFIVKDKNDSPFKLHKMNLSSKLNPLKKTKNHPLGWAFLWMSLNRSMLLWV